MNRSMWDTIVVSDNSKGDINKRLSAQIKLFQFDPTSKFAVQTQGF